jgi:putative DNA primase/helicase
MSGYSDWLGRMPTNETGYQTWTKEGHQHGWTNGEDHHDQPTEEGPPKALTRAEKDRAREEAHEQQRADWQAQGMRQLPPPDQPMAVARQLVADLFTDGDARFVQHWRGSWWRWYGPHWAEIDDSSVRAQVYTYTEDAWYEKLVMGILKVPALWAPNRRKIADLREALEAITHQPAAVAMPSWIEDERDEAATEFVSMRNGLLHIGTRRLVPHTPAFFNGISVPFDYDPHAPEPVEWLRFLEELWPDDPESIATLRQWFGYVISGSLLQHKILLLVGPRRGGKGTILRVLSAMVGRANVASPTLSSVAQNFGLEPLIGKPMATITDARLGKDNVHQTVERLLSISGQDMLTIDRKYKTPWTGTLPTRFMIISNELPKFGDASGAIASRFVTLVLTRNWLGREDLKLTNRLLTELPGILAWALDGLTDLETTGAFREPRSSRDAVTALADLVSPTSAFVRDRCTVDAEGRVPVTDLYATWRGWAQDNGHAVGSVQNFGIRLRAVVPTVRVVRSRDGDTRSREYEGLRLLVPADPDEDGGGPAHDDQGRGPRGPEGAPQGRSGPQGPRSEPLWNRPSPVSDPWDSERATDDDGELDESVRP